MEYIDLANAVFQRREESRKERLWFLGEELPRRFHFEFPGKVALDDIQQGAVLRKQLLKLLDNAQRDLGQQAVALGDQMGQIAHVQIRLCASWLAFIGEEMEGANLPGIDGFHFA